MTFKELLERSHALYDSLVSALDGAEAYDFRWSIAQRACVASWDHAAGLRLVLESELLVPAIGLLRMQYEAFTRAAWLGYTATDNELALISAPLSKDAADAAVGIPTLSKMIAQLGKTDAPGAKSAHEMLHSFKEPKNWGVLNSYVHAGLHPLTAVTGSFPVSLAESILRFSNGLAIGNGMVGAVSSGDTARVAVVRSFQLRFSDCCPPMLKPE